MQNLYGWQELHNARQAVKDAANTSIASILSRRTSFASEKALPPQEKIDLVRERAFIFSQLRAVRLLVRLSEETQDDKKIYNYGHEIQCIGKQIASMPRSEMVLLGSAMQDFFIFMQHEWTKRNISEESVMVMNKFWADFGPIGHPLNVRQGGITTDSMEDVPEKRTLHYPVSSQKIKYAGEYKVNEVLNHPVDIPIKIVADGAEMRLVSNTVSDYTPVSAHLSIKLLGSEVRKTGRTEENPQRKMVDTSHLDHAERFLSKNGINAQQLYLSVPELLNVPGITSIPQEDFRFFVTSESIKGKEVGMDVQMEIRNVASKQRDIRMLVFSSVNKQIVLRIMENGVEKTPKDLSLLFSTTSN